MSDRIISGAVAADAQIANTVDAPTKGVDIGGGIHISIPIDWLAQSMIGNPPPGCTAAQIQTDGTMIVTDRVQTQLAVPAVRSSARALVGDVALTAFDAKVAVSVVR